MPPKMEDNRTINDLANEVMFAQDACNLSGLVYAWSRAMKRLCVLLREQGQNDTDARNTHPINVLWASKVASLTQCESGMNFSKAFDAVSDWVDSNTSSGK